MLCHDLYHWCVSLISFLFQCFLKVLCGVFCDESCVIVDPNCVRLCKENGYPCFDYQHPDPKVHVMEQVGEVKINEVWKALEAGMLL